MFLISSASFASTLHRLYSVKIIIVIHFRGNLLFQDNVAALGFTPIFNILLKLFLYKDIFYFETIANTNFIVVEIISLGLVFELIQVINSFLYYKLFERTFYEIDQRNHNWTRC